jgi:hypothetical protein
MVLSRTVRAAIAGLGISLFAFLIWKVGLSTFVENMHTLGWGLAALLCVGGLSHVVKTWAWWFTFDREHRTIPFPGMLKVRLAGEAVGQLSFSGPVLGETTRALMVRPAVPMINGASSVTLDRGMYTFTGALLIVVGALLSLVELRLPHSVQVYNAIFALGLAGFVLLIVVAIRRRWRVLSAALQALERIGVMKGLTESKRASVRKFETIISSFYAESRGSFWSSLVLNLFGHALGVVEVYLVLWLLGVKATLLVAFLIEGLTKVVNLAGTVIPGNFGAYEGGNMIILRTLGLGGPVGLTLGIARRIRGLFWAGVGFVILLVSGFHVRQVAGATEID